MEAIGPKLRIGEGPGWRLEEHQKNEWSTPRGQVTEGESKQMERETRNRQGAFIGVAQCTTLVRIENRGKWTKV
jgi:predicted NUDIX family NTP pyrophosphohydrolase